MKILLDIRHFYLTSCVSKICYFHLCNLWMNLPKNVFKKSFWKSFYTLYTCKQPLMIAYGRPGSARDNFGIFIHQFQSETKTLIRKLERIIIKLYKENVSLLFNQTCLNERLMPNHTHTHTHTYIYIYIYIKEITT